MKNLTVLEHADAVYRARAVDSLGTVVPMSAVDAVLVNVWQDGAGSGATNSPVYVIGYEPSEVMFASLQTPWEVDATGYNLQVTIPAVGLPNGDNTYTVEILLTRASDGPVAAQFTLNVVGMRTEGTF